MKSVMTVIEFLNTLDPNVRLVEYNHTLLCFCDKRTDCKLIQPIDVLLTNNQSLGPSTIQTKLQFKDKEVPFNTLVTDCIRIFSE